jgi:copper transport protein
VQFELQLAPSPPTVGLAEITLKVADGAGQPIEGADVRLEGNMNHAGMVPTFAELNETAPGSYTGTLEFTMGGDWFILATVIWPDGRRLERKLDVPGVQAR